MELESIYTSLSDALVEIEKRRKDIKLQKDLEVFWGENKPDFLKKDGPRLVFSKSLITPNLEFKYFLDVSRETHLKTYLLEYGNGKFVGKNQEKRHLGKIFFYHGRGKHNGSKIDHLNVVDFNTEEGKLIKNVKTLFNKKLSDFHHDILSERFPEEKLEMIDISDWFDKTRYLDAYYLYYLSLFLRDNILFENFLFDEEEESKFTLEKFLPSFQKIVKIFGVKPIIVPLLPREHAKSDLWFTYDEKVEKHIKSML
ncbi:MAG: hypothetical protein WC027_02435 [Candidatus Paceibacterota bacterium]